MNLNTIIHHIGKKVGDAKSKGFECIKFEKADTAGDTSFFDECKAKGLMDEMEYHYQMTKPVFGEYKTYPKWVAEQEEEVVDEVVDEVVGDEELCMDCNLAECVCGLVDGNDKNKARITIKTKEWYKENIEGKIGSLMFPSDWREVKVCDLDPRVYSKMRKTYLFTGRIQLFAHTGMSKNAEQNKMVKYKFPHFVDEGWEGAYQADGYWVSDYVYGEVVVVV